MYVQFLGILLRLPGKHAMLLDCGEGTWQQIQRRYGPEGAQIILSQLKCIWISHFHADHHAGLLSLLSKVAQARDAAGVQDEEPLVVIGPKNLRQGLKAFSTVERHRYLYLDTTCTIDPSRFEKPPLVSESDKEAVVKLKERIGLQQIESALVPHCSMSAAVAITLNSGTKIAFSGDCVRNHEVERLAKNATLLIHEATFGDDLRAEADSKMHSCAGDAINVARSAKADHLILMHFSGRYPKMPKVPKDYDENTTIAFDLLSVNEKNYKMASKFTRVFEKLFEIIEFGREND